MTAVELCTVLYWISEDWYIEQYLPKVIKSLRPNLKIDTWLFHNDAQAHIRLKLHDRPPYIQDLAPCYLALM